MIDTITRTVQKICAVIDTKSNKLYTKLATVSPGKYFQASRLVPMSAGQPPDIWMIASLWVRAAGGGWETSEVEMRFVRGDNCSRGGIHLRDDVLLHSWPSGRGRERQEGGTPPARRILHVPCRSCLCRARRWNWSRSHGWNPVWWRRRPGGETSTGVRMRRPPDRCRPPPPGSPPTRPHTSK